MCLYIHVLDININIMKINLIITIIIINDIYYRYYKAFDEKPFTNRTRIAEYLSWIEKMENSLQCSETWFDVSLKGLTEYWECEGNPTGTWRKGRGYKTILDLLLVRNFLNIE